MRIQGLDAVLSGLIREVVEADKRASDVVGKVAQNIKDTARSLAPRRTGALADSIHVSVTEKRTTREIGPSVSYGRFVEYGTSRQAPQPFMEPAADRHEPELVTELERVVGEL